MKQLTILIFACAFFSCGKQNTAVVMTYQMTQCADPWMGTDFNKDKEGVLKKFLIGKNIQVLSISIKMNCDSAATCLACVCKGCDLATVEVPEEDVADMEIL